MKTRATPISETKTQALVRVLSAVAHGYTRLCTGSVPRERLPSLVSKFDSLHGIAHTKAQRVMNRRAGRANALFAAYYPPEQYLTSDERLPWILLATEGEGLEGETMTTVVDRPAWLDYQLCRHNDLGEVRWTWRRTRAEMAQLYAELRDDLARQRYNEVARMFERLAHQPGFHGVRSQSRELFAFERSGIPRTDSPSLLCAEDRARAPATDCVRALVWVCAGCVLW
jgi:hypothetical protein